MLKRLLLKNWRSHERSELEFSPGTNVLVGIMGSGKSSAIDAMCFALFGTFPKLSRKDTKLSDVLRRNSQEGEVTLVFESEGKEYTVKRVFGSKSDAEIYCSGRLLEKTPKAVTRTVEEALGIDYGLFSRAIYAEQNKMDYFLVLDPKRRKEEIDSLLGLDRFESAREGAMAAALRARAMREAIEKANPAKSAAESSERVASLEGQAAELGQKAEAERKKLVEISSKLKSSKGELEALEGQDAKVRSLEAELAGTKKSCAALAREIGELSSSAAQYSQKEEDGLSERLANLKKDHEKLRSALLTCASKHASTGERAESSKKSRKLLEEASARLAALGNLGSISESLSSIAGEIGSLEGEVAKASYGRKAAGEAAKMLSGATAKCPVCDSALGEESCTHLRKLREGDALRLAALESELLLKLGALARKREGFLAAEKSAEHLAAAIERERENAHALEELLALHLSLGEEKGRLNREVGASEQEIRSCSERMAGFEAAKKAALSLKLRSQELEDEKRRAGELEGQIVKDRVDADRLALARKTHSELAGLEKSILTSLGYIGRMESVAREELENEKGRLALLRAQRHEAESLSRAEGELAIYKNCLAAAQTELRGELVEAINSALASVWEAVYPYSDMSGARLGAIERGFVFEVLSGGEWKDLESVASGGERASFCLALRIAFATVLVPRLSWLILDEPTHNLDYEATLVLRGTLEERLPSLVEQTIVITHEQSLMDTDAKVYCLLRDKGKNEATRVVPAGAIDT